MSILSVTDRKHIFLIGEDPELLEKFQALEHEFRLSWDARGRQFIRNGNGFRAPTADMVVVRNDYYQKHVKHYLKGQNEGALPGILILALPDEIAHLQNEETDSKIAVATLPLDMSIVSKSIADLLNKKEMYNSQSVKFHYKQLFLKAPVAHFLVDPFTLDIIEANTAAALLFHKANPKEIEGLCLNVFLPGSKCQIQERFKEAINLGECNFACSFPIAGSIHNLDFAFYLSQIKIDDRILIFMTVTDITHAKNTERILTQKNIELQKIKAELDYFIYSISHELRAPLVSVLGLLGLFETEKVRKEQNRYLALMKESINKLDKIIHDFIDYARNERMKVELAPIDFGVIMEKVKSDLVYLPQFEKVQVSLQLNQNCPFYSDPRRVEIILRNLLCNCIKFRNHDIQNPWAKVIIEVSQTSAKIRVDDNGVGISPLKIPKIFNMFYTGNQESNGSGIGLYIVKEIIHKLDGTCEVVSKPGVGARFLIYLPNKNFEISAHSG